MISNTQNQGRLEKMDIGVTLRIPQQLIEEINIYHKRAPGKEWGGPVFYDVMSGSFEEGNIVLECTQIFIGDVGTAHHTEYDFEDLNKIDQCYEMLAMSKWGGIHTHHNMSTFFSGEDHATLLEKAVNYIGEDQYYLSLIVNHQPAETWKARICKRVQSTKKITTEKVITKVEQTFSTNYKWWENIQLLGNKVDHAPVEKTIVESEDTDEVFAYDDCIIEVVPSVINHSQLLERYDQFITMRDKPKVVVRTTPVYQNYNNYGIRNNVGFNSQYNQTSQKQWERDEVDYQSYNRELPINGSHGVYSDLDESDLRVTNFKTKSQRITTDHDLERMFIQIQSFINIVGMLTDANKLKDYDKVHKYTGQILNWFRNMIHNQYKDISEGEVGQIIDELDNYKPATKVSKSVKNRLLNIMNSFVDKDIFEDYFTEIVYGIPPEQNRKPALNRV